MTGVIAHDVSVVADGATLLDGVTCAAQSGELVAVVGPNGAGKSTLLAVLSGDLPVDQGGVSIGGRAIGDLALEELAVTRAVLPHDLPSEIQFSVGELVALGRHPYRRSGSSAHDRYLVAGALEAVGLLGWDRRIVATLSAGERIRAHLARVIAQATPVVLLDEPTAFLDVANAEHIMQLCEDLAAAGRAVVAVVHDLNVAARYADRIVILTGGVVAADGPPADVLHSGLLSEIYGQPMEVIDHPRRDCPLVLVVDR